MCLAFFFRPRVYFTDQIKITSRIKEMLIALVLDVRLQYNLVCCKCRSFGIYLWNYFYGHMVCVYFTDQIPYLVSGQ